MPRQSDGFLDGVMSKISTGAAGEKARAKHQEPPRKKSPKPPRKVARPPRRAGGSGPLFMALATFLVILTAFGFSTVLGGSASGTIVGDAVPYFACPDVGELGTLNGGEEVMVSGKAGDWMVVHADVTGFETVYIHSDFVSLDGEDVRSVTAENCNVLDVEAIARETTTSAESTSSSDASTSSTVDTTAVTTPAPTAVKPPRKGKTAPTTTTTTLPGATTTQPGATTTTPSPSTTHPASSTSSTPTTAPTTTTVTTSPTTVTTAPTTTTVTTAPTTVTTAPTTTEPPTTIPEEP